MKRLDLTGKKFGRLTVLSFSHMDKNGNAIWISKCECGTEILRRGYEIKSGHIKSCGCLKLKHGELLNHRKTGIPRLYQCWINMIKRCTKPNNLKYPDYGGRGITICVEWLEYIPFREWALSTGYQNSLTLDRKDNNGNYEPLNCQWVTIKEQIKNRRPPIKHREYEKLQLKVKQLELEIQELREQINAKSKHNSI
jgi:hypothetical protein